MTKFSRFSPNNQLKGYIHGYWLLQTSNVPKQIELVPDGYPEILFVRQGALWYRLGNSTTWQRFSGCGMLGQLGGQFQIYIPAYSEILFVKFHPWAVYPLLRTPMHLLNNGIVELAGLGLKQEWKNLSYSLTCAENIRVCCKLLNRFFLEYLNTPHSVSPLLHFSVQTIFHSGGVVSLDQLKGQLNVSHRYLQRLFKQRLGLSPKHYARIIRVKKASINMLNPDRNQPLVQIAAELNYFDQSHFLKDFKSIVGKSPTTFLRQEREFSPEALAIYLQQWVYS